MSEVAWIIILIVVVGGWALFAHRRETGEYPHPDRSWLMPGGLPDHPDNDPEGD